MKTRSTRYYQLLVRVVISLQLLIITIAIPSVCLADTSYYKALFNSYFKISGYIRNHDDARYNDQNLLQHS